MGNFKKFREFVESKIDSGNKGNKEYPPINVKDSLAGEDYDGPLATKPPQEPTKGKKDKALPYKADGEIAKGVAWTAPDEGKKKGFGWEATPGMTPQTSSLGKSIDDKSRPLPKPKKKLKTEQFIETTKDMSDGEFVNYILEQHDTALSTVTDLFGNEFTPDPTQTIQYVAGLMLGNPVFMDKLIRELKRRDGLSALLKELMEHGDTYEHVVEHLEEPEFGMDRSHKLARTMNDRYMSLFDNFDFGDEDDLGPSDEDEDKEMGESVGLPLNALMGKPGAMNRSPNMGMPGMGGQMPGMGGAGGGGGGAAGTGGATGGGTADAGGVFGQAPTGGVFSQQGGSGQPPPGPQPGNVQSGMPGGGGAPQFPGQPPLKPVMGKMDDGSGKRPKVRNSAAHYMIDNLAQYKYFKDHMKSRCVDC